MKQSLLHPNTVSGKIYFRTMEAQLTIGQKFLTHRKSLLRRTLPEGILCAAETACSYPATVFVSKNSASSKGTKKKKYNT